MDELRALLLVMNTNDQSISLTWEISKTQVYFLDLEISINSFGMQTKTHFKETERIHIFWSLVATISPG